MVGWIKASLLVFESNKTVDYQSTFKKWSFGTLTSVLPSATIVVDNTPNHSGRRDKVTTSSSTKAALDE